MGTNKGFTGQYADATGLDYYNARYYDPVAGVFLSADTVQGNAKGMNPYGYVGGNPETLSDPTGMHVVCGDTCGGGGGSSGSGSGGGGGSSGGGGTTLYGPGPPPSVLDRPTDATGSDVTSTEPPSGILGPEGWIIDLAALCPVCIPAAIIGAVLLFLIAPNQLANSDLTVPYTVSTPIDPGASFTNQAVLAKYGLHLIPRDVTTSSGSTTSTSTSGSGQQPPGGRTVAAAGGFCSFTPDTQVSTNQGEQPIGKLHPGDKVWAYNPKTHKMELQPILHVWTHQDHDLVDLTLTTTTKGQNGRPATHKSEVLHTTSEHPFFTIEQGFVPAGKLHPGMHVLQADGRVGVVTGWKLVVGTKLMYNLEVAQDHTFTVGVGQWVVHNKCGPQDYRDLRNNLAAAGRPVQSGQNPHHIIPCEFRNHGLIDATSGRTGGAFDINAAYNGRPLWNYDNRYAAANAGEPYHAGHYAYNQMARGMLNDELTRLQTSGILSPDTAFDSLMSIIDSLNTYIDLVGAFANILGPCAL